MPRPTVGDDQLRALVAALCTEPDEGARERGYAAVQAHLDATVPLVPLYAPQRIAVVRRGLPTPSLDHDMYRLDAAWLFGASR